MDERLFEAARTGNIIILKELLEDDPLILDDINIETVAGETPLHIASLLGHIDFVREVINQNSGFARRVNRKGYSPLHLASSNGPVEVVRELLKIDHETEHELCRRKDRKGRTALHHATIKGRIMVMSELICAWPNSAFELTDHGETVLHLTVKSENGCKALKVLVEGFKIKELLNYRDEDGNTVLHLAIEKKQNQTIKYLLSQASLDINAVNANGLTALDILLTSPKQSNDTEIKQMLLAAKGVNVNPKTQPHLPPTEHEVMCKIIDIEPNESNSISASQADEWTREMRRVIMVMVVLIATVTFEVALKCEKVRQRRRPQTGNRSNGRLVSGELQVVFGLGLHWVLGINEYYNSFDEPNNHEWCFNQVGVCEVDDVGCGCFCSHGFSLWDKNDYKLECL